MSPIGVPYHPHQVTVKKKDMNKDNIQELLKPRYLVNTPWFPSNNYQSGDIVTPDKFTGWHPKYYPVIFRRLDWWEYRDVKDMPEYVKQIMGTNKGKVYKIADPSQNGRIWHEEREIEYGYFLRYAGLFEPATETQFNDYKKQVNV